LVLLGLLSLFVLSATVSASASAIEPTQQPYWTLHQERLTTAHKIQIKGGSFTLLGEIGTQKVQLRSASQVTEENEIEGFAETKKHSQDKGAITFKNITLFLFNGAAYVEEPNCAVMVKKFKAKTVLWYHETTNGSRTNTVQDVFFPEEGNIFANIAISGTSCPSGLVGTFKAEGDQGANISPEQTDVTRAIQSFPSEFQTRLWQPNGSGGIEQTRQELQAFTHPAQLIGELVIESTEPVGVFD